ncbi:glutathione S-transferase [Xylaria digitata]|nr:glutathione S-transferase [Xylaria digitata]
MQYMVNYANASKAVVSELRQQIHAAYQQESALPSLPHLPSTTFMSLQRSALSSLRHIRSVITRPSISIRIVTAYPFANSFSSITPYTILSRSQVLLVKSSSGIPYSTISQRSPELSASPQTEEDMSEPTGLIAKSGIELLTFGTPNGYKISILLEELKEAYGKEYTWQSVNILKNTQKEPWFVAAGANGRIPAIVDHDRDGFAVFEGLAILGYLTRRYDPEHRFGFPVDSNEYDEAETWMAWQHGGLGPMQGQANHFLRFSKEKIPYGIQRYIGETERLYGVLNTCLADREYVVGGKFSIADINLLGWVNAARLAGIDLEGQFPHVQSWLERCLARPAVQKGFAVPNESSFSNAAVKKAIETDPEIKKQSEELAKLIKDAKEKYGYKYASP